jgi:acyl-CoA thioesterase
MTNRHRTKAAGLPLALPGAEAGAPGVDAQALAERVAAGMFAGDRASRALGMRIESVAPGHAAMTMTVRDDMLNGHAICHGGFIFLLADSTFAFACNSYNRNTVAQGCSIDYLAPARAGDVLRAVAVERSRTGRTGVYDIDVRNQDGRSVALFRGKSYRIDGHVVDEPTAS